MWRDIICALTSFIEHLYFPIPEWHYGINDRHCLYRTLKCFRNPSFYVVVRKTLAFKQISKMLIVKHHVHFVFKRLMARPFQETTTISVYYISGEIGRPLTRTFAFSEVDILYQCQFWKLLQNVLGHLGVVNWNQRRWEDQVFSSFWKWHATLNDHVNDVVITYVNFKCRSV